MDNILYVSTRGAKERDTASRVILRGIASDGGLFVPERMPELEAPLERLKGMDYRELAFNVMKPFLTDFTDDELRACVDSAYDGKFTDPAVAPVVPAAGAHFLELFHGPTLAFKDMALTILPYLMKTSAAKNNMRKRIVILAATSGDTGKAALQGFADVPGVDIMVLYPKGGVSAVQERQMTTQEGGNTCVVGIEGNFDDCQTTMKGILTDPSVAKALEERGAVFSSANSINLGRLLPQVAYYVYAYCRMVENGSVAMGQPLNFTVPTGNFGNILAAYYAKQIGLPVGTLICASNSNNVLTDFINTGVYDRQRPFLTTMSPSMDILISSNLERLLYHLGGDTGKLMQELAAQGNYTFKGSLQGFWGGCATEDETLSAINRAFAKGYTMDTHTAVAYAVYEKYRAQTQDATPNVIVSTASPFKFPRHVCQGIGVEYTGGKTDFELVDMLSKRSGLAVPAAILNLDKKPVRHSLCCKKEEAAGRLLEFIAR